MGINLEQIKGFVQNHKKQVIAASVALILLVGAIVGVATTSTIKNGSENTEDAVAEELTASLDLEDDEALSEEEDIADESLDAEEVVDDLEDEEDDVEEEDEEDSESADEDETASSASSSGSNSSNGSSSSSSSSNSNSSDSGSTNSSSSNSSSSNSASTNSGSTSSNSTNSSSSNSSSSSSSSSASSSSSSGAASAYDDGSVRTSLTATELTVLMGNGINLGNTMEACSYSLGAGKSVSTYETLWGQPVTTAKMIQAMKDAGFDTIRIPVAWMTNATNYSSGDYTINEAYLDRVEEIVNYARAAGMYVIINDHWDGGWYGMFGSSSSATREKAMEMYVSMWTQIAERFKDYSDYVIFESANEELGDRLNDTDVCSNSGSLSESQCYAMVNKINQAFVDTVRSTGGNNAYRFLLIAGYNTDITKTIDSRFSMPTDSASKKLLLSVHYYDPSSYTLYSTDYEWGTVDDYEEMNTMLAKLVKFTNQGYGVIIGEYGALPDGTTIKSGAVAYNENVLNNCDLYGYCPVLWDCNGVFSKSSCKITNSEMAAIYTAHSYAKQKSLTSAQLKSQAQAALDSALASARASEALSSDVAVAWIMYADSAWSAYYSVGDTYSSSSKTSGVVASDVTITGAGTYTVSLDFTGTSKGYASGISFSALGIANGKTLYSGYTIKNLVVKVNGTAISVGSSYYTTSDDGKCTRVNLYNTYTGNSSDVVVSSSDFSQVKTISITFDFVAP